jgi:hypothetical protein
MSSGLQLRPPSSIELSKADWLRGRLPPFDATVHTIRQDRVEVRHRDRHPLPGHRTVPGQRFRSYSRGSEYRDQVQPQQGYRCAVSGPEEANRVHNQTGAASSYPISGDPRALRAAVDPPGTSVCGQCFM